MSMRRSTSRSNRGKKVTLNSLCSVSLSLREARVIVSDAHTSIETSVAGLGQLKPWLAQISIWAYGNENGGRLWHALPSQSRGEHFGEHETFRNAFSRHWDRAVLARRTNEITWSNLMELDLAYMVLFNTKDPSWSIDEPLIVKQLSRQLCGMYYGSTIPVSLPSKIVISNNNLGLCKKDMGTEPRS